MRYVAPLFVAFFAFAIVAACSSDPDKPARTVNCAGGVPVAKTAAEDSGSCAGVCLAALNPCTNVELGDAGSYQSCPSGYGFAKDRYSCASGASCCTPLAVDGGADGGADGAMD